MIRETPAGGGSCLPNWGDKGDRIREACSFGARLHLAPLRRSPGPLFSCQGAIADRGSAADRVENQENQRLNLDSVAQIVTEADWKPILLNAGLQTGILLSQASKPELCRMDPSAFRDSFRNFGIGLSTYENGYVRISMPQFPLTRDEVATLKNAFELVA